MSYYANKSSGHHSHSTFSLNFWKSQLTVNSLVESLRTPSVIQPGGERAGGGGGAGEGGMLTQMPFLFASHKDKQKKRRDKDGAYRFSMELNDYSQFCHP